MERLDLDDPMLRAGVYSRGRQLQLVESLHDLAGVPLRFGLSHGDLTSRNLLVPDPGPPLLIDWGSASFGPVPWTDLLVLDRDARHAGPDPGPDGRAFLDAMDLDLEAAWPTLEKFRELQLLDLVRWAAEQRPDRLSGAVEDLVSVL